MVTWQTLRVTLEESEVGFLELASSSQLLLSKVQALIVSQLNDGLLDCQLLFGIEVSQFERILYPLSHCVFYLARLEVLMALHLLPSASHSHMTLSPVLMPQEGCFVDVGGSTF